MKQRVEKVLKKVKPEVNFETVTDILESGVFSSLDFFSFILELSEEFGVEIDVEQMLPENFASVASICKMLEGLLEK